MNSLGRFEPVTAKQRKDVAAGRKSAEDDVAAHEVKLSDDLIGTDRYYQAAYQIHWAELTAVILAEQAAARIAAGEAK